MNNLYIPSLLLANCYYNMVNYFNPIEIDEYVNVRDMVEYNGVELFIILIYLIIIILLSTHQIYSRNRNNRFINKPTNISTWLYTYKDLIILCLSNAMILYFHLIRSVYIFYCIVDELFEGCILSTADRIHISIIICKFTICLFSLLLNINRLTKYINKINNYLKSITGSDILPVHKDYLV